MPLRIRQHQIHTSSCVQQRDDMIIVRGSLFGSEDLVRVFAAEFLISQVLCSLVYLVEKLT